MNIELFGKELPLYGIFFWLGIFAGAICAVFVCKRKGLPLFDLTCSAVYTIIAAMIGAKLLYIAVSLKDIIELINVYNLTPWQLLPLVLKGGFVFYGGLIGGLIGLIIYARQFKIKLWLLLDIYASVIPLGHALGRVGCFFGGCCFGIEYNGPLSYTYTTATGAAPIGVALFPVQLFEALCLIILFAVQIILVTCFKDKERISTLSYIIFYSIIRFNIEFLRGDAQRGSFLLLSTSQWISIALCIGAIITGIYAHQRAKKEALPEQRF